MSRIYISALETEVPGLPRFDERAVWLLDSLASAGLTLFWEKASRPYEQIEREISECQALLAIVDPTWTSSTWMAIEVIWALGHAGLTSNPQMAPIPVFLYPVDEPRVSAGLFPFGWSGTLTLQRDVQKAVEQILQVMGGE